MCHSFTVISLMAVQVNSKSDRVGHLHWLQWLFALIADCSERYASEIDDRFKETILRVTLSLITVNAQLPSPIPMHITPRPHWPPRIVLLITVNVNGLSADELLLNTVNVLAVDSVLSGRRS